MNGSGPDSARAASVTTGGSVAVCTRTMANSKDANKRPPRTTDARRFVVSATITCHAGLVVTREPAQRAAFSGTQAGSGSFTLRARCGVREASSTGAAPVTRSRDP